MTTNQTSIATEESAEHRVSFANGGLRYDQWMEAQGIPIHRGYYIEDLRTVEVGWWPLRESNTAFIQLHGQEGVSEARVTEIPPTESLAPVTLALDELVYVLSGEGSTTVEDDEGGSRVFEWHARSLFLLHHGQRYRHHNTSQTNSTRLLQYNYMPIAMSAVPDPDYLLRFDRPVRGLSNREVITAHAAVDASGDLPSGGAFWYGDFFSDLAAWSEFIDHVMRDGVTRGAGGKVVRIGFPDSEMHSHMSIFPSGTYKKAHRHGPGRSIVIPSGEGFSVLWEEGGEKIFAPWHEGSLLTPPDRWFHQHFNVGEVPARYLALSPMRQFSGHAEKIEDRARDQIEYVNEDPWIRERFEEELDKHGLKSHMPTEAYTDPKFAFAKVRV